MPAGSKRFKSPEPPAAWQEKNISPPLDWTNEEAILFPLAAKKREIPQKGEDAGRRPPVLLPRVLGNAGHRAIPGNRRRPKKRWLPRRVRSASIGAAWITTARGKWA